MAQKNLWAGMLAVALVFGMMAVGCDINSGDSSTLEGRWRRSQGQAWEEFTFRGNTFTFFDSDGDGMKGTFSIAGDTLTLNTTHYSEDAGATWESDPDTDTLSFSLSADGTSVTLRWYGDEGVYTKQ